MSDGRVKLYVKTKTKKQNKKNAQFLMFYAFTHAASTEKKLLMCQKYSVSLTSSLDGNFWL